MSTIAATLARTKTCIHGTRPKTTCKICESTRKRESARRKKLNDKI